MPSARFTIHRAERFPSVVKLQMEGVPGEVRYVRERTCRNVSTTGNFRCSECDAADLDFDKPSYCHGCGRKVVDDGEE